MVTVLDDSMNDTRLVVSTIKKMKNVQISNQGTVLKLQEDLLKDKNEQLRSIHSAKLKKSNAVFKTFVREEERQKNVISLNRPKKEKTRRNLADKSRMFWNRHADPKALC